MERENRRSALNAVLVNLAVAAASSKENAEIFDARIKGLIDG